MKNMKNMNFVNRFQITKSWYTFALSVHCQSSNPLLMRGNKHLQKRIR